MDIKEIAAKLWVKGEFESKRKLAKYLNGEYGLCGYKDFDSFRRSISRACQKVDEDTELIEYNVRLAKQKQKFQDTNRIERKAFREHARIENAVEEYGKALNKQLKHLGSKLKLNLNRAHKKGGWIGIIQITDVHANELVDLPHNQYNFEVLSKRLKKYISESLNYFKYLGTEKVVMAFTGDLLNSDRRLDELLNQATNRSKASVIMAHFVVQCILDVAKYYPVNIVSVLGNESRVSKEMTFSDEAFSDNYDFTIVAMAKEIIEASNIPDVNFLSIDKMETILNFGEQSWLFAHDISKYTDKQGKTQQAIGRYALSGNKVDFAIGGHIHAFRGTDISCRSGSMVGSNSYNEHALNLYGRASGVCYAVKGKDKRMQYIDLQEANNKGYEYESKLEAYNIKSSGKLKPKEAVLKIVI